MVESKQLFSPFFAAALICAVLIYTGIAPVRKRPPYRSLVLPECTRLITGTVASNPVKNSRTGLYTCDFRPLSAVSKNGVVSECGGTITIMLPAPSVEAFFPGKLYSRAGNGHDSMGIICEKGAVLEAEGTFSNGAELFRVKTVRQLPWRNTLPGKIAQFRARCRLQFRRTVFYWKDAGGLFLALVSGSRDATDRTVADSFRNAGLSHILALSGMHLSLFSGIAAHFVRRKAARNLNLFLQFCITAAFVWFAGISPSLFRAFLCSTVLLVCAALRIKTVRMLDILSFSFLVHIIMFPADVLKLSFQLSYGALLGILLFSEIFTALLVRIFPPPAAASLGASSGAQVITAPLSARVFGSFAPVGIIATAVVSPCVTFFIYAGLICFALSFILPFCAPAAAFFMNLVYTVIVKAVRFFSAAPYFSFS